MSSQGQPADTTPPEYWDTAGKWLAARYQLTNREREQVKTATRSGQPLSDPRLQAAVCDMASEILADRMRIPGIVGYYMYSTIAGIYTTGLWVYAVWPHHSHETITLLAAVAAVMHVISYVVMHPRRMRKKVAKALRANSGIE